MNEIPRELKWKIMVYLDLKDIFSCLQLNESFYYISNNDNFWKEVSMNNKMFVEEHLDRIKSKKGIKYHKEYKDFIVNYCGFTDGIDTSKMTNGQSFDHLFKLLMVGDSGVGKTSLMRRFVEDQFHSSHYSTIGVDFKIKSITDKLSNRGIKLQVTSPFDLTTPTYTFSSSGILQGKSVSEQSQGAHGFVVCFDLQNRYQSFEHVNNWLEEIFKNISDEKLKKCIIICGCKSDLKDTIKITHEKGVELAKKFGLKYFDTSSKDGVNVKRAYNYLVRKIMNVLVPDAEKEIPRNDGVVIQTNNPPKPSGGFAAFLNSLCTIL